MVSLIFFAEPAMEVSPALEAAHDLGSAVEVQVKKKKQ